MDYSNPRPGLSEDAAIVLALAETAVPHGASAEDEAERWVRIMRVHGEVGCALQSLGVPEGPLENAARTPSVRGWRVGSTEEDVVELVERRAIARALAHGVRAATTIDVLFAVMAVYGPQLDRALYIRGTTRAELVERLRDRRRAAADRRPAQLPDAEPEPAFDERPASSLRKARK